MNVGVMNGMMFVYCESMKRNLIQNLYMYVGVMKDYKLRDLRASHTHGIDPRASLVVY
jgi:hypothetical protein